MRMVSEYTEEDANDFWPGRRCIDAPTSFELRSSFTGSEVLPIRCSSCLYNLTNGIDHKLRLIPLNIVPALFSDDMFTSGRKASQSPLHFQPECFTFSDH